MTTDTKAPVSPYAAAQIVNKLLEVDGVAKKLPPQMFYTYVAKGYIKASEDKKISMEDLQTWYVGYVAKAKAKIERAETKLQEDFDENQLELALEAE
jgi:hypothetical protein